MEELAREDTVVILTTAPTGLGHLRVLDALAHGLGGIKWVEIGLENVSANKIHALGSRIPILTKITEFYQTNPLAELIVSKLVIFSIRFRSHEVAKKFKKVVEKYPNKKRWVIVCTHYSLAHEIAAAKKYLEKHFKVSILLSVIVTDDSPQRVWAVRGADLIFAPSSQTANILSGFVTSAKVIGVSFPVSPKFERRMSPQDLQLVEGQLNPASNQDIHIQIPISGAAVQLDFFEKLIQYLSPSNKCLFTIIGQKTMYTSDFFERINTYPHIQLSIGLTARETVNFYESVFFQGNRPSLEITKPSEQIYKALVHPSQAAGVLLLLTPPVGRQEYDNVNFLRRHRLLPSQDEQKKLEEYLLVKGHIPPDELPNWQYLASHWRAVNLPINPVLAGKFILQLKESGILYAMLSYTAQAENELTPDGVSQIWQEICKALSS